MHAKEKKMSRLWLLKGDLEAPGWQTLRKAQEDEKVDIIHLDPKVWAMVQADEPPMEFEGLVPTEPADGLYLDPNGSPLYLANGDIAKSPEEVIRALGDTAVALLEEIQDGHAVLERLGRVF
jgi:hypothetical protein